MLEERVFGDETRMLVMVLSPLWPTCEAISDRMSVE
jgi:hypothetical protein